MDDGMVWGNKELDKSQLFSGDAAVRRVKGI
jgi:hypothetical protein